METEKSKDEVIREFKKKFRTPRGIAAGDVQNSAIRYCLTEYSRSICPISKDDIIDSLEFFDWKCPYSGKEIKKDGSNRSEFELDHIVPINRFSCGLNIKGNVVFVSKEVNRAKAQKNWEDFLRNDITLGSGREEREKRIKEIKRFQAKTGYDKYLASDFVIKMSNRLREIYTAIGERIASDFSYLKNIKP